MVKNSNAKEIKKVKKPLIVNDNGVSYEGEWKGDVKEGFGIQIWPDGAKYEGK